MEERSKWELFKEDVEMWLDLAICAAVFGLAYSLGKIFVTACLTNKENGMSAWIISLTFAYIFGCISGAILVALCSVAGNDKREEE